MADGAARTVICGTAVKEDRLGALLTIDRKIHLVATATSVGGDGSAGFTTAVGEAGDTIPLIGNAEIVGCTRVAVPHIDGAAADTDVLRVCTLREGQQAAVLRIQIIAHPDGTAFVSGNAAVENQLSVGGNLKVDIADSVERTATTGQTALIGGCAAGRNLYGSGR